MKLKASEIKKLPRVVAYESAPGFRWVGKSDGKIHEGLYLVVYPEYTQGNMRATNPVCVPLSRIYSF